MNAITVVVVKLTVADVHIVQAIMYGKT